MDKLVLFCKSYDRDMLRARRMAASVQRHNQDQIPLYVSVPQGDLAAFKRCFGDLPCNFITDESVLEQTRAVYGPPPPLFPSHLGQQLIKLEFWRRVPCDNYAWLDSDSYFIRPFKTDDFFHDATTPYTVCHLSEDLHRYAEKYNPKVWENFEKMAVKFKGLFKRAGENYDFGYPILIWSCAVLRSLHADYLQKNGQSIYELLYEYPCEMQLYGEYALHCRKIPIVPVEPLFMFYHYAEQFFEAQMRGESEHSLAERYLGVVMQSNWTNLSEKKKNDLKRFKKFLRNLARQLHLIRFKRD